MDKKDQQLLMEENDSIDNYFQCITSCSLGDEGIECLTACVQLHLKEESEI